MRLRDVNRRSRFGPAHYIRRPTGIFTSAPSNSGFDRRYDAERNRICRFDPQLRSERGRSQLRSPRDRSSI